LEKESSSLWELCEGSLEGGSFTTGTESYVMEGSGSGQLSP